MKRYYIGIDPGKDGGIAIFDKVNKSWTHFKMPNGKDKEIDCYAFGQIFNYPVEETIVAFEDVHAIKGSGAKATFNFGRNMGYALGILQSKGLSCIMIQPKKWQALMHLGVFRRKKDEGTKDEKNDTKLMSLRAAQALHPGEQFLATPRSSTPHDGIVDAYLICHWLINTYKDGTSIEQGSTDLKRTKSKGFKVRR